MIQHRAFSVLFWSPARGSAAWAMIVAGGLLLTLAIPAMSRAGSWPIFQNGGHNATTEKPEAVDWSASLKPAWEISLSGYGQSSPVVIGPQIYVSAVEGAQKNVCTLTAFALSDGKQLWRYEQENPSPEESTNYVSKAAPTPAADERGVICLFEGGLLVAVDPAGKVRWERNLVTERGPVSGRHGLSSSLEQDEHSVYVWIERETEPYVLAVDKTTGKNRWEAAGLGVTSWASPRLIPVGTEFQLVLSGIGKLAGLDAATGQLLWTFTEITGNSTPTPMPVGDGKFLIGATVGREGGDAGRSAESNGVIEIVRDAENAWQARYVWRAARATSSFGSPIAADDMAYFVNRSGVLYGLDLKTGEERFAERLSDSIWATPVVYGNQILFPGKSGTLDVVAGGAEFASLASIPLWEAPSAPAGPGGGPVLYAAIIVDGHLLVRRGDQLTCLRLPVGQ